MQSTVVKELMTKNPTLISPNATLQEAAEKMQKVDCGILPVGSKEKIEGIITDRDIVIRAIAKSKDPNQEKVRDYMSKKVYFCKENDSLRDAADKMHRNNVSRLVVSNDKNEISGILSFGGIIRKDANAEEIVEVVEHARGRSCAA